MRTVLLKWYIEIQQMKDKGITNGKNRNIVAEELNVDMLNAIGEVSGEERREKVYKAKIKDKLHILLIGSWVRERGIKNFMKELIIKDTIGEYLSVSKYINWKDNSILSKADEFKLSAADEISLIKTV